MKFIHIADVHWGAEPDYGYPWSSLRKREIKENLVRIVTECNHHDIELLLVAGDLFHGRPTLSDLAEVGYILAGLSQTRVVIIAGNHDFIGINSPYEGFEWPANVCFMSGRATESIYFEDINTEVYGRSYHGREQDFENPFEPKHCERINILLFHGGDINGQPVSKEMFDRRFDYIALGHIHKPAMLTERMAYSGSLEPLDRTETGEHGYILGNVDKSGITLNFVPFSVRSYIQLEVETNGLSTGRSIHDMLAEAIARNGSANMYKVRLIGFRNEEAEFVKEEIANELPIVEWEDETRPEFDLERLCAENRGNLLELFISSLDADEEGASEGVEGSADRARPQRIKKQALQHGLAALLSSQI